MPPLSIMVKPASSLCNMACEYCFYHDVSSLRTVENLGVMAKDTSEKLIKSALAFANGESIAFAFQGGEPLLAGRDYFQHFVDTVKQYNLKNSPIYYSLQTNGTLIDQSWTSFFAKYQFLIGLSLDGNFEQNKFRVDRKGQNKFYKILTAATLFEQYKVEFNILTVLTGYAAQYIEAIYRYLAHEKGFRYLQFIPCLRPFDDNSENDLYMTDEQYAHFLIHGFNLYVKDYMRENYVSIRQFDNFVRLYLGQHAEQCGMTGHCTHQFVVEGNGNIYPCDFYCLDEWLLGNIHDISLSEMANSKKAKDFIRESIAVPEKCKQCKFVSICRAGGCKRTRADRDYCKAYQAFFSTSLPLFSVFRNELKPITP